MEKPTIIEPCEAAPDIATLPSWFPIPGPGILPVNASVPGSAESVPIDTGLAALSGRYVGHRFSDVDTANLRWPGPVRTDREAVEEMSRGGGQGSRR